MFSSKQLEHLCCCAVAHSVRMDTLDALLQSSELAWAIVGFCKAVSKMSRINRISGGVHVRYYMLRHQQCRLYSMSSTSPTLQAIKSAKLSHTLFQLLFLPQVRHPKQYRGLLGILVSAHTQDMLNAAPFKCVICGDKEKELMHQPMSYLHIKCVICGDKAKELMHQPMSYLHIEVPTVVDFAQPVCGKGSCDIKARQERRNMLSEVEESQGFNLVDRESYFCRNCRKRDNLQFCARCKVIAYCSKSCQKAHWPTHKKSCVKGHGMP